MIAIAILLLPLTVISFACLALKLITCPCNWEKKRIAATVKKIEDLKKEISAKTDSEAVLEIYKANPRLLENANLYEKFGQLLEDLIKKDCDLEKIAGYIKLYPKIWKRAEPVYETLRHLMTLPIEKLASVDEEKIIKFLQIVFGPTSEEYKQSKNSDPVRDLIEKLQQKPQPQQAAA